MAQITTYFTSSSGGGISGSGAATRVAYWSGASSITSDSGLFYDPTNNRVSISAGTSPDASLTIKAEDNTDSTTAIRVYSLNGEFTNDVFKVYSNGRIDSQTLLSSGAGSNNMCIGLNAGQDITTGAGNTLLGAGAGENVTSSTGNTCVGTLSGGNLNEGTLNTFVGYLSAYQSQDGDFNSSLGTESLSFLTSGSNNSSVGAWALAGISTSSDNSALGYEAGRYRGTSGFSVNSGSSQSIYIGSGTRAAISNSINEIVIGYGAVGAGTNSTTIGNASCSACVIKGDLYPSGNINLAGDLLVANTRNFVFSDTTGTKIGTSASQKLAFWNATPNVQPTSSITSVTAVHGTGTSVKEDSKYNGYDLGQIVAALQRVGILA